MNHYTILLLVNALLNEEENKILLEKIKTIILALPQSEILKVQAIGTRTLAYPIKNHTKGYYCVLEAKLEEAQIKILGEKLNFLNTQLLRFLITKNENQASLSMGV